MASDWDSTKLNSLGSLSEALQKESEPVATVIFIP